MKKILLLLGLCTAVNCISAKEEDLSQKLESLQKNVTELTSKQKSLISDIEAQKRNEEEQENVITTQQKLIDSLQTVLTNTQNDVKVVADSLGINITKTQETVKSNAEATSESIKSRTIYGALAFVVAVLLAVILFFLLKSRMAKGKSTIDELRSAQDKLQGASLKLDDQLMDLIDKQLKIMSETKTETANAEPDHSLVLGIANEVARIEQNLQFMDPNTKGVSNLKNRAAAINATLKSKGYEVPKLVGETYHEGDNMDVTMELDEELPVGTHIIRRVVKPLVMFDGKMIQAPKVVVAYNE